MLDLSSDDLEKIIGDIPDTLLFIIPIIDFIQAFLDVPLNRLLFKMRQRDDMEFIFV